MAKNSQFLNMSVKLSANPGGYSDPDAEELPETRRGLQRQLGPSEALAPEEPAHSPRQLGHGGRGTAWGGELPSPLFLDEPGEGFPVSLTGLVPSSHPFGGMRRVELPPSTQNNTLLYICMLGWDCRHRFP